MSKLSVHNGDSFSVIRKYRLMKGTKYSICHLDIFNRSRTSPFFPWRVCLKEKDIADTRFALS